VTTHHESDVEGRGLVEWVRLAGVAVQFLTRIPVRVRFEPGDLRRAAGAFPAVGVLVAGIGVGIRWSFEPWLGASLATVAAIGAMVVATGAFHEDGFADSADGLWGGRTAEERLRIMHDARLGTYGTVALIGLFATKYLALEPMTVPAFAATLVPAMVLARASSLWLLQALPPASQGLVTLVGPPGPAGWAVAIVTCAASSVGFGRWAWLPLVAAVLTCVLASAIARRKMGGINGDLLGAANQLVEVAVLLAGVVVFSTR
jgi:adenosylcobinamide-GDP ribazoletransferase